MKDIFSTIKERKRSCKYNIAPKHIEHSRGQITVGLAIDITTTVSFEYEEFSC